MAVRESIKEDLLVRYSHQGQGKDAVFHQCDQPLTLQDRCRYLCQRSQRTKFCQNVCDDDGKNEDRLPLLHLANQVERTLAVSDLEDPIATLVKLNSAHFGCFGLQFRARLTTLLQSNP